MDARLKAGHDAGGETSVRVGILGRPVIDDSPSTWGLELLPLDIASYADGGTGVPYVASFAAAAAGPHVLVTAVVHGNELCGAHALAYLLDHQVRPKRGRLTLAFANVAAYQAFDPANPTASRYLDEDFNRVWSAARLDGADRSRELERARALRPVVETADYLLDLHSMLLEGPPLILCGTTEKGRALARGIGFPAIVVADAGHADGVRLRDYGRFGRADRPQTALLVECGQHWRQASVAVALETTFRLLSRLDAIESRPEPFAPAPGSRQVVEVTAAVTIQSERFEFTRPYESMEVVPRAGTPIASDGEAIVRTPYDDCVLVMPAGTIAKGQTAVRFGRLVE